jgi:hypothetical protein
VVTIFAYALLIGAGTSSCLLVLYGKSYLAALAQPGASLYLKVFWASCWYRSRSTLASLCLAQGEAVGPTFATLGPRVSAGPLVFRPLVESCG